MENKASRLNHARQMQAQKHAEVMKQKRIGSRNGPPKIVGLVALSDKVNLDAMASLIANQCTPVAGAPNSVNFLQTLSAQVENREARFTFVQCRRDPVFVADVAKVADILYLVAAPTSPDDETLGVDMLGNHFMQLLKAQGLPSVIGVTQGIPNLANVKHELACTKMAKRFFHSVFDDEMHVVPLDTQNEVANLLRWTVHARPRDIAWRSQRAHLLGEHVDYLPNEENPMAEEAHNSGNPKDAELFEAGKGALRITGFLRGDRSMSANQLVHITGVGDFPVISIEGLPEDTPVHAIKAKNKKNKNKGEGTEQKSSSSFSKKDHNGMDDVIAELGGELVLLSRCDDNRDSMVALAPVSSTDAPVNDQSVIPDEELAEAIAGNPSLAHTSNMFTVDAQGRVNVKQQQHDGSYLADAAGGPLLNWHSQSVPRELLVSQSNDGGAASSLMSKVLQDGNSAGAGTGLGVLPHARGPAIGSGFNMGGPLGMGTHNMHSGNAGSGSGEASAFEKALQGLPSAGAGTVANGGDSAGAYKKVWDDLSISGSDDDDEAESKQQDHMGMGMGGEDYDDNGNVMKRNGGARAGGRSTSGARGGRGNRNQEEEEEEEGNREIPDEDEDDDDEGNFTAAELRKMKSLATRERRMDPTSAEGKRRQELLDMDDKFDTMSTISQMTVRTAGGTSTGLKFADLPYKEKVARLMEMGEQGEDRLVKVKRKLERDEMEWPDEVDCDRDIAMKQRFFKYRTLKSFKHSTWDAELNRPAEYKRIYKFANFTLVERNAKDVCEINDMPEDLDPETAGGRQVRPLRSFPVVITIANVPPGAAEALVNGEGPALVWALFRHEHKVSVLHMNVKRHDEFDLPIKGKDPMHIQVGFRRFIGRPIYSTIVPGGDKTMVNRFMPRGKFVLASVYGRVMFPPASVLMFPAEVLGTYKREFEFNPLAISGTLVSCDPSRLLIKRSVLTGYPVHTHKMHAVVRHMFHNADDVKWFMKVDLWTKEGLKGHITEPRGLHGLFKCTFDGVVRANDTICISIYKRQFPPWNPNLFG